jgi:hypothetical protein
MKKTWTPQDQWRIRLIHRFLFNCSKSGVDRQGDAGRRRATQSIELEFYGEWWALRLAGHPADVFSVRRIPS